MKVNVSTTTFIVIPANRRRECFVFRSIDPSTIRNSTKELLFSGRRRIGDIIRDIKNLILINIIGLFFHSIDKSKTNTRRNTDFTTFLNMNLAITNIEDTNIVFSIHQRAVSIKVIKLDKIPHGSILEQMLTLSNTTFITELAEVLNTHIAQRLMISLCQTTNTIYQRLTTLFLLESKEERLETMEDLSAFNHICLRQQIISHIAIILNRTFKRTDSTIVLDNESSTSQSIQCITNKVLSILRNSIMLLVPHNTQFKRRNILVSQSSILHILLIILHLHTMRSLGCTQSGINHLLRAYNTHDIHSTERLERWTRIGVSNQFLNRNNRSRAKTDQLKTISRAIMRNLLSKQSNVILIDYLLPKLMESLDGIMSNIISRKNLRSIISRNIVVIELTISSD